MIVISIIGSNLQSTNPALSPWLSFSRLLKQVPFLFVHSIHSSNITELLACHLRPSFRSQVSRICSYLRSKSLCSGWHRRDCCVRQGIKPKARECWANMLSSWAGRNILGGDTDCVQEQPAVFSAVLRRWTTHLPIDRFLPDIPYSPTL